MRDRPTSETTRSMSLSSCPGTTRNVVGSARTSSYSARLAETRTAQRAAHSQTKSEASASTCSALSAMRCLRPERALRSSRVAHGRLRRPLDRVSRLENASVPHPSASNVDPVKHWPESVERVAAVLRGAGIDARVEEFREGTPTARAAAKAVGAIARADRQVARLHLRRPADARARPRRPARRRERRSRPSPERRYARVAKPAEVLAATGFEPGGVAPFPAPAVTQALIARSSSGTSGLDRRRLRAAHGRDLAGRSRAPHECPRRPNSS